MARKKKVIAREEAAPDSFASLRPKYQAFVDAYVGEAKGNATEAARISGFKDTKRASLAQQGSRLYRNVEIAQAIQERVSELALTPHEILARMAAIATMSIKELYRIDEEGHLRMDLKRAHEMGALDLVKSITPNLYGLKLELYDAQAALVQLGKYHKLWTDKVEHTGKDGEALFKVYEGVDAERV